MKNFKVKSDSGHEMTYSQKKAFVSREFLIMIKESAEMYAQKKAKLAKMKKQLEELQEIHDNKKSEERMSLTKKILSKREHTNIDRNLDLNEDRIINNQSLTENSYTEATSQDERIIMLVPDMANESERILLLSKREKSEAKQKLLKAKELVISACGLMSRI